MKRFLLALLLVASAAAARAQTSNSADPLDNFGVELAFDETASITGTVTSVGLSGPSEFVTTCGTNPVLTTGTLCLDWATTKRGHGTMSKAITVKSPTNAENVTIFYTPVAITIAQVRAVVVGSSPSVTYNVKYGTDRSAAGTSVTTSPAATTNTTTGVNATLNNTAVAADSYVWLTSSAQSGTVSDINVTVIYTEP